MGIAFAFAIAVMTLVVGVETERGDAQGPGETATTVSIPEAVERTCFDAPASGAGVSSTEVEGVEVNDDVAAGAIEARLAGPDGSDWDVAVFDSAGEVVAAGAEEGASEVASGFVTSPGPLTVQVCRISGEGTEATLDVSVRPIPAGDAPRSSLVRVKTPTDVERKALESLGLDVTEHGGDGYIAVVLHGAADRAALDRAGLDYTVTTRNLDREDAKIAEADAEYAAETDRSALPSGSDTYRRLFQINQELKDLAEKNPEIVRPISLPNETYEGRTVQGIEITEDASNIRDGKPVFLQMGVHHAREWPSGEHAMEWAYELVRGYKQGNDRVTRLMKRVRTIVIPVVNPDGFNASREAGEQQGSGNGEDGATLQQAALSPNEYRRKNCRFPVGEGGSCLQPAFGVASGGVDPNRNYGAFWGGPGASDSFQDETFRGPAPFSEPESQNIRELVSQRQVTMLITNHTFSDLVLRPPGLSTQPNAIDEPALKQLGDAMAAQNGYLSQKGYELYDTTGTTEDWSYNATGGFGYTFEIYCDNVPDPTPLIGDPRCSGNFHPTYPNVVDEYEGTSPNATAIGGGGNREAYFLAAEAAANRNLHSVLKGQAPPGAIIRLEKDFDTPTSIADPASVRDHLKTEMKVPDSGDYTYDINPSTRPLVAQARGRQALGPVSGPVAFNGGFDPVSNVPCAANQSTNPNCFDDFPFTIGANADNDSATVQVSWGTPVSDWDVYVYTDSDGDGTSLVPDGPDAGTDHDVEPNLVASSATGATDSVNSESATFTKPETADGRLQAGNYVVRVENYLALEPFTGSIEFAGPEPFVPAQKESWKLTCEYLGEPRLRDSVEIDRGQEKKLDLSACGTRGGSGGGGGGKSDRCRGKTATLFGTKGDDRILGTKGRDVIVGRGGDDKIRGAGGNDFICGNGGRDKIDGGGGKDKIKAGGGKDRAGGGGAPDLVSGGGGNDRLDGGPGRDQVLGGKGKDRCRIEKGERSTGCEA